MPAGASGLGCAPALSSLGFFLRQACFSFPLSCSQGERWSARRVPGVASTSEPLAGQLAVGKVLANRTKSGGRFPDTYCGVLFQRGQFSFVHGRALPSASHASKQWQTAVAIAKIVDQNLKESPAGSALFFHARYVNAGWHAKRVASIGNHSFYRGSPGSRPQRTTGGGCGR